MWAAARLLQLRKHVRSERLCSLHRIRSYNFQRGRVSPHLPRAAATVAVEEASACLSQLAAPKLQRCIDISAKDKKRRFAKYRAAKSSDLA
jgi:protein subunit release factor A